MPENIIDPTPAFLASLDQIIGIYQQIQLRIARIKLFIDMKCQCEMCSMWQKQLHDLAVEEKKYRETIDEIHKRIKARMSDSGQAK